MKYSELPKICKCEKCSKSECVRMAPILKVSELIQIRKHHNFREDNIIYKAKYFVFHLLPSPHGENVRWSHVKGFHIFTMPSVRSDIFWFYTVLILWDSETLRFWHFQIWAENMILTLPDSDTFKFWHYFQILTLSDSGTSNFPVLWYKRSCPAEGLVPDSERVKKPVFIFIR